MWFQGMTWTIQHNQDGGKRCKGFALLEPETPARNLKHIYIYIAYNLIRWAIFRLQDVEKQRERRKTKAKEGKGENEDKTLKHEKPPHQVFFSFFWIITGEKLKI